MPGSPAYVSIGDMPHHWLRPQDVEHKYADPELDPKGLYGHEGNQAHPNEGEATPRHNPEGLVRGTAQGKAVGAHFALPGTEWEYVDNTLVQRKGPRVGTRVEVGEKDVFYDATNDGGVIGHIRVPHSMKDQKGYYDVAKHPVHDFGPEVRPNRQSALANRQALRAMADEAHPPRLRGAQ